VQTILSLAAVDAMSRRDASSEVAAKPERSSPRWRLEATLCTPVAISHGVRVDARVLGGRASSDWSGASHADAFGGQCGRKRRMEESGRYEAEPTDVANAKLSCRAILRDVGRMWADHFPWKGERDSEATTTAATSAM